MADLISIENIPNVSHNRSIILLPPVLDNIQCYTVKKVIVFPMVIIVMWNIKFHSNCLYTPITAKISVSAVPFRIRSGNFCTKGFHFRVTEKMLSAMIFILSIGTVQHSYPVPKCSF